MSFNGTFTFSATETAVTVRGCGSGRRPLQCERSRRRNEGVQKVQDGLSLAAQEGSSAFDSVRIGVPFSKGGRHLQKVSSMGRAKSSIPPRRIWATAPWMVGTANNLSEG